MLPSEPPPERQPVDLNVIDLTEERNSQTPPCIIDLTNDENHQEDTIHVNYLSCTLQDVAEEDNLQTLKNWLEQFTPSAQPRTEAEHFYVRWMQSAIREKLMNCFYERLQ